MSLPPEKWVAGMLVRGDGEPVLLVKRTDTNDGWWVEPFGVISDDLAHAYTVCTFADLSRDPVEGERALQIDGDAGRPGAVWVFQSRDLAVVESGKPRSWISPVLSWLAPLAPSAPQEPATSDPALSGQTMSDPSSTWEPAPAPRLCECGQEVHPKRTSVLCGDCFTHEYETMHGIEPPLNRQQEFRPEPRDLPHPLSGPIITSPWLQPRRMTP